MKQYLIACLIILLFAMCQTKKQNLSGIYKSRKFDRQQLKLNADSSFEFVSINPIGFLGKNIDSSFFRFTGTWKRHLDTLILNNNTIPIDTEQVKIISAKPNASGKINFQFQGIYAECIGVWQVADINGEVLGASFHNPITNLSFDALKYTGLIFSFNQGIYKNYTFFNNNKTGIDYVIQIRPIYNDGDYGNKKFIIKNQELIKVASIEVYKKISAKRIASYSSCSNSSVNKTSYNNY